MNSAAWVALVLVLVIAVIDWWAVAAENHKVEYVAKPATMVALAGLALVLHPDVASMRWWFVAAIVFSMIGDVFLMLPDENLFIGGLGSFLVGHVAYIGGFVSGGMAPGRLAIGAVCGATALLAVGPTIVKGAKDTDPKLPIPVFVYMSIITVMVACAVGSGPALGIIGALFFYLSDFSIGWSKFVQPFRHSSMVIITTYHVAQILLVISLVSANRG